MPLKLRKNVSKQRKLTFCVYLMKGENTEGEVFYK